MKKCEVIIVGAGPAGSTAAYLLSNWGHQVFLFDKANFPRKKLCGGILTDKNLVLMNRIFNDSFENLRDKNIIDFWADEFEVWLEDKQIIKGEQAYKSCLVKREFFDEYLLKQAKTAGTKVFEGKTISKINPQKKEIITDEGISFVGEYIIGADGVNSVIRNDLIEANKLGCTKDKWHNNLAMALEVSIERDEVELKQNCPVLHLGIVNWGYGWIFPNSDKYVVGIGGLISKNKNFREVMYDYLNFLNISEIDCKIQGHPVPYGNFINKPVSENILLAGDAAGLVDAMTAEGIFYAQRSGELAAHAINNDSSKSKKNVGDNYCNKLSQYIIPEISASKWLRSLFYFGPECIRYPLIKFLLNLCSDKLIDVIHGHRSYKLLKKIKREVHTEI